MRKAQHQATYLEMEKIISKVRLNANDIAVLNDCGICTARAIINQIQKDMIRDNSPIDRRGSKLVPTERALKMLGLNASLIHSEAKKMKER